ncbi:MULTISPECIES: hypothetical protein [unclassified Anaeromyxobacter]|uniref:hypothetical protein n=1 Tax=unclassified Anaeromyxobacter TaxID=2620896 RepID=UPI001F5934DD|nr:MULTISPECIES: hypothetical protein [unclassified Anaeromyxobacter]
MNDPDSTKKLELVRVQGPTAIHVDAAIDDKGDLVLSGQDVGQGPKELLGSSDLEYFLTVRREHKDALVLALLEQLYRDDGCAVSRLRDLLAGKGIPGEFFSF